jgi:hypothetical protein
MVLPSRSAWATWRPTAEGIVALPDEVLVGMPHVAPSCLAVATRWTIARGPSSSMRSPQVRGERTCDSVRRDKISALHMERREMSVAAQAACQSPIMWRSDTLRGRFLLNNRRPGQGFWSQTSSRKNRRSTVQPSGGGVGSCSIGANATPIPVSIAGREGREPCDGRRAGGRHRRRRGAVRAAPAVSAAASRVPGPAASGRGITGLVGVRGGSGRQWRSAARGLRRRPSRRPGRTAATTECCPHTGGGAAKDP